MDHSDPRDRHGRGEMPSGLVRPYVLGTDHDAAPPPDASAEGGQRSGWLLPAVPDEATDPGQPAGTVAPGQTAVSRRWDTLIMDPPSYQMTIPPGGSLPEHFVAQGGTTSPAGCTFDGMAC